MWRMRTKIGYRPGAYWSAVAKATDGVSPAAYSKGWFVYFLFFRRPPSCLVFIFVGVCSVPGLSELTVDFLIGIDPRGVDGCCLKE